MDSVSESLVAVPCSLTSAKSIESAEDWMRLVQNRAEASGMLQHSYLLALHDGAMERDGFLKSQIQFFHAVQFFPRALAVLMMRMPDSVRRAALVHNLAEEHGWTGTGSDFDPLLAHDQTFLAFLDRMGVSRESVMNAVVGSPVRTFNLALAGACLIESPAFAYACLGAIEATFADISTSIGSGIVRRGWLPEGELVHYSLHAHIDKRHARDFFSAMMACDRDCEALTVAGRQGVDFGLHLFDRLYRDLTCDPGGVS